MARICATLRGEDRLKKLCDTIRALCGKKELNWSDDLRRDVIERFAGPGKRSQKDLSEAQAQGVVDYLRSQKNNEWKFVFNLAPHKIHLGKKIYRCAEKIGALQTPPIPVMSKAWVEGTARQALGYNAPGLKGPLVKKLEHCEPSELLLVIQILESRAKKIKERSPDANPGTAVEAPPRMGLRATP